MAKFIFYFCAKTGTLNQLVSACEAFSTSELVVTHNLDIAVLQPRSPDMLTVPPQGEFIDSLDLVCEIVSPAGCPLESLKVDLKLAMSTLLALVVSHKSYVVSAHSRTFQ
jgi:hypothetical protein